MNKHRLNTILTLERMGIARDDITTLLRASTTLHTWAEHECNGVIQRDEATGHPYWYSSGTDKRLSRALDRETGTLKRAKAIAERYGLNLYHQTDPRGCALYLLRPGDVPSGQDASSYYSRGIAIVSG